MFSKSLSRSDRFKEMSRQQELIEEKKRKIQEEMERQRNSSEDLSPSGNNSFKQELTSRSDVKPTRPYNRIEKFRQMSRQQELIEEKMRKFREKKEKEVDEQANIEDPIKLEPVKSKTIPECPKPPIPPPIPNIFSNDGSFLDQFLKLSSDIQEINKGDSDPGVLIKTEPEESMNIFKSDYEPSCSVKTEPVDTTAVADEKIDVKIEAPLVEVKVEVKEEPKEVEVELKQTIVSTASAGIECSSSVKLEPSLETVEDEAAKTARRERKRKSRWGEKAPLGALPDAKQIASSATVPTISVTGMSGHMISKVTRSDPGLLKYAASAYGTTFLSEEDWKKAEDNYKVHLLYQDMLNKRAELDRLHAKGKHKFEYDSDEETEGGTWEHKLREKEMTATRQWADSLTEMAKGKHHIGDFLPPDELKRFMEKYKSVKGEGDPDLSDYKEFKLKEDNKGFQMLQKLGWTEGQGLGSEGAGIVDPINKAKPRDLAQGLGAENPGDVSSTDDEYAAYRKRMMLAYRFRPNPLNNPRRPYY